MCRTSSHGWLGSLMRENTRMLSKLIRQVPLSINVWYCSVVVICLSSSKARSPDSFFSGESLGYLTNMMTGFSIWHHSGGESLNLLECSWLWTQTDCEDVWCTPRSQLQHVPPTGYPIPSELDIHLSTFDIEILSGSSWPVYWKEVEYLTNVTFISNEIRCFPNQVIPGFPILDGIHVMKIGQPVCPILRRERLFLKTYRHLFIYL